MTMGYASRALPRRLPPASRLAHRAAHVHAVLAWLHCLLLALYQHCLECSRYTPAPMARLTVLDHEHFAATLTARPSPQTATAHHHAQPGGPTTEAPRARTP
ncbi:hypothetical protein [Streptomyces sp. NRRL S-1868]|uniref:hypothetical protein n=1 Tax=Streptomyces sp. NRRL S-1868 TaxID=1463892 RepID=UPI000A96A6FB|nr:hypothetical protein [Streptomyces sp. NRRL S-1868]